VTVLKNFLFHSPYSSCKICESGIPLFEKSHIQVVCLPTNTFVLHPPWLRQPSLNFKKILKNWSVEYRCHVPREPTVDTFVIGGSFACEKNPWRQKTRPRLYQPREFTITPAVLIGRSSFGVDRPVEERAVRKGVFAL
jgi:hypothetical protein